VPGSALRPVPCESVVRGILAHIGRQIATAEADVGLPVTRLNNTMTGLRHLDLATLARFCERYQEYPDLPDVIGGLVRDWLRTI